MILKIEHLSKSFRHKNEHRTVLHNICLEVRREEFVVLVGPSGCGKSTLLKIIAGLMPYCEGNMKFKPPHNSDIRRGRQLLFQEAAVYPWKTVLENVTFGLSLMGLTRQSQYKRAMHYLEKTGLEGVADYHPHQLSGGMNQKLQLARCLAVEPEMLLMDEPFASLDEISRMRLNRELLDLWHNEKKTVIFVTHSLDEAVILADRIVIFNANPGSIYREITVDLKRQRDLFDPDVIALRKEVREQFNLANQNTEMEWQDKFPDPSRKCRFPSRNYEIIAN